MNYYSRDECVELQAAVTDICTPQGDHIHKTYKLEVEEIGIGSLSYNSRFAIPIGTTLCIIVYSPGSEVRLLAEVLRNQQAKNGKYSVGCRILYGNSDKDSAFSTEHWFKPQYVSVIH